MDVEVIETLKSGGPRLVRVGDVGVVAVGDKFRGRGKEAHRTVQVTAFWTDGTHAFVKRNTSRRKQSIKTASLLARWDRTR